MSHACGITFRCALVLVAVAACNRETSVEPRITPAIIAAESQAALPGYEAIDLGTLGGSFTSATDISDDGLVVGSSERADGVVHSFVWEDGVMHELPSGDPAGWPPFSQGAAVLGKHGPIVGFRQERSAVLVWNDFTSDPVTLPTGSFTINVDLNINEKGTIVGGFSSDRPSWSIVWRDGVAETLGGLDPSSVSTMARDVNKDDQVVGSSQAYVRGFRHGQTHPFIWENGVIRDLGLVGFFDCGDGVHQDCGSGFAIDINDHGVAVGTSTSSDGRLHAFRWENGAMQDLGIGSAYAVNEHGQILGTFESIGGGLGLWEDGSVRALGTLGGAFSSATVLNERGEVAGWSQTGDGVQHAMLWSAGVMHDLGPGFAVALNKNGDVVAQTVDFPRRAVLWRRSGVAVAAE
jgi:probable HAF family extracellular repeat protein